MAQVSVRDAAQMREDGPDAVTLLDVREQNERATRGAVAGAVWIPLPALRERMGELDRGKTLMVMCQGGFRSSIATSLLKTAGMQQVANVAGGFDAWSIAFPEVAKAAPACAGR